ncbi:hypothetical protein UlMin_039360 [Ulmus minor]
MEVLLDAALGIACEQLLQSITSAEHRACMFDSVLSNLESTVRRLRPRINKIDKLNQKLDYFSENEILEVLKKAEELVRKGSDVAWWNYLKKYKYSKKLLQLDALLRKLIEIDLQVDQIIVMMEVSVEVEELKRLVLRTFPERKSSLGGEILRKNGIKILPSASRLKRSIQHMPSWFIDCLISVLRIPIRSIRRITGWAMQDPLLYCSLFLIFS